MQFLQNPYDIGDFKVKKRKNLSKDEDEVMDELPEHMLRAQKKGETQNARQSVSAEAYIVYSATINCYYNNMLIV